MESVRAIAPVRATVQRENQHGIDLKGMYLGLLLRALTGGLAAPGMPEPFYQGSQRSNDGCDVSRGAREDSCLLTWDGYQRAIESGRVLERVLDAGVGGAVVEVGVWRGGMSAYFQGILTARVAAGQDSSSMRELWLCDSFHGLPRTNRMASANAPRGAACNSAGCGQRVWGGQMIVNEQKVRGNLERHRLLGPNVHFLKGYVNDSLPSWPTSRRLAVLRVDVDIYSATYDVLHYLYPLVEPGGAVLFDDWKLNYSAAAIHDYRQQYRITEPIEFLPGTVDPMAFWIKKGSQDGKKRPEKRP